MKERILRLDGDPATKITKICESVAFYRPDAIKERRTISCEMSSFTAYGVKCGRLPLFVGNSEFLPSGCPSVG
jgi:hypothetical protein